MAKIAVAYEEYKPPVARLLGSGEGWSVSDVVCAAGPSDKPFEEEHSQTSVGVVLSGSFQYRSATGSELMTPGLLLLGNAGECFRCGHEHGVGDRCVAFLYSPAFLEGLAFPFQVPRLPPLRELAPLVARVSALLAGDDAVAGEELSLQVVAQAAQVARGTDPRQGGAEASSLSRVTRVIRMIDNEPDSPHDLKGLAQIARLSPYHFLRTFEGITGTTPHQYLLRARLRRAAIRLRTETARISEIAFDCGFGDVSNFNRTFRAEFGASPRAYRSQSTRAD